MGEEQGGRYNKTDLQHETDKENKSSGGKQKEYHNEGHMEVGEGLVQLGKNKEIRRKRDETRGENFRGEGGIRGSREEGQEKAGDTWNDIEMEKLEMYQAAVRESRVCLQELDQNIIVTENEGKKTGSGK